MANVNQKQRYSYKVSYAQEVGSSFDPDIEDISRWEQELAPGDEQSGNFISVPTSALRATAFSSF